MTEALVCEIQRFSVHDGPGIRSTVFFKGCPLACLWCHNPEAIRFGNEVVYAERDCLLCGDCAEACPEGAISYSDEDGRRLHDGELCKACMKCVEACPSEALSPAARPFTSRELLDELLRDRDFYGDDGGVTISGGEPLVQLKFLAEFLPMARNEGLNIVAQTAGRWSYEAARPILDMIDLFLFDVKVVDEDRHRGATGQPNDSILDNLRRLVQDGRAVEVRMPVVPGVNDDVDNLNETRRLLESLRVNGITLLKYHPLGEAKLKKFSAPIDNFKPKTPGPESFANAENFFRNVGVKVNSA